jgi:NTE family protein
MKPRCCILWAIFTVFLLASPAEAQERPTVGLALSGGAARGFAHVGVMKVLEEVGMPVDYIAGTSMGAIVGGLYACGYSASEIESIIVHVDWEDMFSDAVGRRKLAMAYKPWDARYAMTFPMDGWRVDLPSGLVAGQKITKLLSRLTLSVDRTGDFGDLSVPFVCVATDIVTGEAVVLDGGDLADAIRASMAIPTIFTPVVIDDRLLVDGGVARNLPAVDVRNMGADIVIGVDADEPLYKRGELNSMLRIMDQTVHFQIAGTTREQKKLCDYLISPVSHKQGFQFEDAAYFIERGEEAARAMLPRLQSLADSLRSLRSTRSTRQPRPRWSPQRFDSVYVTAVTFEGLDRITTRIVETELKVEPPLWMSLDEIDDAVDQVYKYDYFERVGYSVTPSGAKGAQLRLRVVEKGRNVFRAGLRYDSGTNLAALLNVTLRNVGVRRWAGPSGRSVLAGA